MIAHFIFTFFPFSTFVIYAYPVVGATSLAPFKSQILTTLRRDRKPYKQEHMCVIKTGSAQTHSTKKKYFNCNCNHIGQIWNKYIF